MEAYVTQNLGYLLPHPLQRNIAKLEPAAFCSFLLGPAREHLGGAWGVRLCGLQSDLILPDPLFPGLAPTSLGQKIWLFQPSEAPVTIQMF